MALTPGCQRLDRLIRNGYFPSELPRPFNCLSFSRAAVDLAALWRPQDIRRFWTVPERYNIPRYGQNRRSLAIVNPVNQLYVANLIAINWPEIRQRLERSRVSEFHPIIQESGPGRAINGVDYDGVSRRIASILGSYGRYAKTDVARFYPSIYTHSIAWSILGKAWVKENFRTAAFRESFANNLDQAVSAGRNGQTGGIPIGPDTSRIISELIMTEIEEICRLQLPDLDDRAVRYVDDWILGLQDEETAAAVLSELSTALYEYQLELNADKTVTLGVSNAHAPEWIHYIRNFDVSSRPSKQRDDLDSFFAHASYLADANERDNVLLYAAKKAAGLEVDRSVSDHLVRWLLYIARRAPTCLSFVAGHLASKHRRGDELPSAEIARYIRQQLPIKARLAHTDEVAWLLFWALEIDLALDASLLEQVCQLRSGSNAVLTCDLLQRGMVNGRIDISFCRSFTSTEGLKSEMWLASYEITKKGWWPRIRDNRYITAHPFFSEIFARDIEFYDARRHSRTISSSPLSARPRLQEPNIGGSYR